MRNVDINVDHGAAHAMIAALSLTAEGRALVQDLESIRYYHRAGKIADLGHGAVLVTAVDEDEPWHEVGAVLLPGRRDRLWYGAADWLGNEVPAALYWKRGADSPVVVPRVLGEWAAECIIDRSGYDPLTPAECHPAAYSVDGLDGMVVTMPYDLQLPGLTRDKWTRRKAAQAHYRADDRHSWYAKGYHDYCVVVYGVDADAIDQVIMLCGGVYGGYTPEGVLAVTDESTLRAACQVRSGYRQWAYFDTCASVQCARHLVAGDYEPRDLTELDVLPEWERELLDGEEAAGVA